MVNRRAFLKTSASALPLARSLESLHPLTEAGSDAPTNLGTAAPILIALPDRLPALDRASLPWQQNVRRVAQSNMTEHDPAVMNIEEWANFWHSADADIVFVSVTGILAFYPSKVQFHRPGKFLAGRDFFGECVAAAKKRGLRVVARMSPDLNWGDALEKHPEWAMRNTDDSVQFSPEEPRLFRTCMFSSYMDDYIPAIIEEVNTRYDVDCFYTNGWPPIGRLPNCHCAICSKLPPSNTTAYWRAFNDRVLELWQRYDQLAKKKKPDSFFFANLGGNVHAGPNLDRLGKTAVWFQADNQGRTYEDPAVWGCSLQGRVCSAVMDGKFAANVTAAYSTGSVHWRNLSKNPAEARMWLNETLASGMAIYFHFIGSEDGIGEDRRWQKIGAEYFQWAAKHDRHLTPRRSLANIGVVMGQSTQLLYQAPAVTRAPAFMRETTHGLYETLLSGRFAFDFVHEDRLQADRLSKYRALILPNVAMLSDLQCQQISNYVKSGGSILASFETSLYDENLRPRADFGLGDVLGISRSGEVIGSNGNSYYGRIERAHPILAGFADTHWLPGAQNRVPVKPIAQPVLTVVPGFVQYPPELAYPPLSHTEEPAVVLRERDSSRIAYFPGDIERTSWLTGHGDLARLMHNTIRWITGEESLVSVEGEGFIEMFAWETEPGYAVHLLNYTNPNAHHGWMNSVYSLGAQTVSLRLPTGARVKSVELLRAARVLPFRLEGGVLRFVIPQLQDYEVAAVTVS
ncbi:MAG: beta-galactosidase trimerization domain-containing protein [Acidobacteria bacterium]|nr:beta-galactosidase trimerization domain-containing protein [Acidobacteriota bacterium]